MKIIRLAAILTVAFLLNECPAAAQDVLFDNGAGGASGVDAGLLSDYDNIAFGVSAFYTDDFSLDQDSLVTSVNWTGIYVFDDTPLPTDDFEIAIYADAGGMPEANAAFAFDVGVARVDSGFDFNSGIDFDIYEFSATLPDPVSLSASDVYWLSIRNRTFGDDDDWLWTGINGDGNSYFAVDGGDWEPGSSRLDFQLFGTNQIPEPSSFGFFAAIAVLAAGRRRPKQVEPIGS